jgi:hypothetical protein
VTVERIPLQRAVASVRDEVISVRPARVELVGALVELAIGGGAIAFLVLLFDRLPLPAMVVLLLLALVFGPIGVLGLVYGAVGVAFVMDRRARTARWQQGFLGMGIGTTDFVPFARISGIEVAGDMDEALAGGQRQDLVRWEVRLLRGAEEALTVGTVVVARPLADEGLGRANRLASALAEMAGVEARLGAVTSTEGAPEATPEVEARPRRRFRRVDAPRELGRPEAVREPVPGEGGSDAR